MGYNACMNDGFAKQWVVVRKIINITAIKRPLQIVKLERLLLRSNYGTKDPAADAPQKDHYASSPWSFNAKVGSVNE